ncbi:MAG: hypothetical protein ACRDC4_15030 [Plesiomonas sp.]
MSKKKKVNPLVGRNVRIINLRNTNYMEDGKVVSVSKDGKQARMKLFSTENTVRVALSSLSVH